MCMKKALLYCLHVIFSSPQFSPASLSHFTVLQGEITPSTCLNSKKPNIWTKGVTQKTHWYYWHLIFIQMYLPIKRVVIQLPGFRNLCLNHLWHFPLNFSVGVWNTSPCYLILTLQRTCLLAFERMLPLKKPLQPQFWKCITYLPWNIYFCHKDE